MTKPYRIILIAYLILTLIGFFSPFIFFCENQLKWSLDIVKTISIFSASIMALFYFDPFGIRKSNVQKQHENVMEVLEYLFQQKLRIVTQSNHPDIKWQNQVYYQHLTLIEIKKTLTNKEHKIFIDFPILIELNSFIDENEKIIDLKNSLYTPKKISEKMNFLSFNSAARTSNEYENHSVVHWGHIKKELRINDELNGEQMTLRNLLTQYHHLIDECIIWLNKNSFSIESLNIK